MRRIDTTDGSVTPPTIPSEDTKKFWQDTESTGGTIVPAWWLHILDLSLEDLIISSGQTPSKTDLTQLSQAIDNKIAASSNAAAGINKLLNSAFRVDIAAQAAGVTLTNEFPVDGWLQTFSHDGAQTLRRSTAVVPPDARYSLELDVTTADATLAATQFGIIQSVIEGNDVADLLIGTSNAKQITLSFQVYATNTGIHCVAFRNAADNRSYVVEYTINAANTWESKSVTITLDTAGTWNTTDGNGLEVIWTLGAGSNFETTPDTWQAGNLFSTTNQVNVLASASNFFRIATPKLEPGTVKTAFRPDSFDVERGKAQRYYQETISDSLTCFTVANLVGNNPTWLFPTEMRAAPTMTVTVSGGSGMGVSGFADGFRQSIGNTITANFTYTADARMI